jgi:tight adherence protein B
VRRRLLVLGLTAGLLMPAAASAAVHLRVSTTDYPNIHVTVVTSKPTTKAPALLENGQPVQGETAVNLANDKSVVLAVDRSQSMRGIPITRAREAAQAFADTKPAGDQIAVSTFATQPLMLTGFSTGTTDADAALRSIGVDAHQGTTLYDDVVLAAKALSHQSSPGRVLIIVTDGNETTSHHTLDQAIASARNSHVAIYIVGIESSRFDPSTLKALTRGTGGHYYAASDTSALGTIYANIADELRRTWLIDYLTAARPGQQLTITAQAPGSGSASTAVSVSGQPDVSAGKSTLPKSVFTTSGTLILALAVGLLVMAAIKLVFRKSRSEEMRRRIQPHVADEPKKVVKAKRQRSSALRSLFSSTEHVLGKTSLWAWLGRLLERGDVPLKTVEFAYVILGAGLLTGFMLSVSGLHGIFLFVGFGVGVLLPIAFVWRKSRKRLSAFDEQLPDLLMSVAASLKAGHSFKQGIQTIVDEAQEPAKKEFQRVIAETSLGRPLDDALADMADRLGSNNFSFIVTAVTIQNQVGGSLAGLFDMVADTVRQRQMFARKIKALTAMGRASAYVLIALPIFLACLLTLLNHKYMSPLFFTSSGHKLIIVGLVMMCIGSAILRKIVGFKG